MNTDINTNTNHDSEIIINKLYDIKERQKTLRQAEMDLKAEVLSRMGNTKSYKDANGTIEKISCKSKNSYDRTLLEEVLLKRGLSEEDIEDIINQSTRRINVSEHLSVKPKRQE